MIIIENRKRRGFGIMSIKEKKDKVLADILYPKFSDDELSESILNIAPELRRLQTETLDFI